MSLFEWNHLISNGHVAPSTYPLFIISYDMTMIAISFNTQLARHRRRQGSGNIAISKKVRIIEIRNGGREEIK